MLNRGSRRISRADRRRTQNRNPNIFSSSEQLGVFESSFKFQRLVYALLFVLVTIVVVYLLFFAPFMRVKSFEITGNKNVTNKQISDMVEAELRKRSLLVLPRNGFLLFPTSALTTRLPQEFSLIDTVNVEKVFPDSARIVVNEREPIAILKTKNALYLLDILGQVSSIVSEEEIRTIKLPVIINDLDQSFELREKVVSPQLVTFTKRINELIPKKTTVKVREIHIPSAASGEVHVVTDVGFRIYFDPRHDADDQASILNDLLEKEIKAKRTSIQYIDMRVENWAYYK